jgi:hypothetical protein
MRPALDPTGHRVPQTKPTCLLHTWRPHRQRPFVLVIHLHQHQPRRNLHMQYLAKNQSTQCCQSLITPGSDHQPGLEPHLEASPATTFRACPSPAPTRVKPQPAPTILSQESVHTTLSITHHTRKRPSTSPPTTHGPHLTMTFCVLSAGGAQQLHLEEAPCNLALRHEEQRANALSLVAMSTTFIYLLMVSLQ